MCDLAFFGTLVLFFGALPLIDGMMDSATRAVELTGYALAFLILGTSAVFALVGLGLAVFAIVRRGERSLLMVIPILLGLFVAIFVMGELGGEEDPGGNNSAAAD